MENKAHAIIAGIFTIAMVTATVLAAIWFSRDTETRVPYQLATTLSVTGLNPQATVRYRGLDVGRVDDIGFDPRKRGQVLVHISVGADTPVTNSTYATLGYQGVTGIAYVELDDDGSNPTPLPSSKDQVARIEMRPGLLQNLQTEGLAIMMQIEEMTRRFNVLLAPGNQQAILSAVDNMSRAASALQTLPGQLEPTLARMPAVVSEAQRSLAALTRLSRNADALATGLQAPGSAIARLGAAADRVDTLADRFAREVLPLSTDVRSSLRALNRTLTDLNQRPQSILFGGPAVPPGPGEPGYAAPEATMMKNTKTGY